MDNIGFANCMKGEYENGLQVYNDLSIVRISLEHKNVIYEAHTAIMFGSCVSAFIISRYTKNFVFCSKNLTVNRPKKIGLNRYEN